jgi:omega-amidase
MKPFRIALCQIAPTGTLDQNIEHAFSMIEKAAKNKADLVALPELFYLPYEMPLIRKAGDMSRLLPLFSYCAKKHRIFICTGSLAIKTKTGIQNSSFLISPSGRVALSYSKSHLFDVRLNNVKLRESALFVPGNKIPIAKTTLCSIGILICYDLRFPEMARHIALSGGELLLVPSVFSAATGKAHWHLLNRARAVENQMFVAAVSQARGADSEFIPYGHSLAVSPWGDIIAEAGERESILFADLDPAILRETRKKMPIFKHRRSDLYGK